MEQTTTGLLKIGWNLALVLIGIPALTTFGVYLLVRFTNVFDAYAGERAKLLAQFHNLDKLVEQTAKLTETAKLIESRVSYDLWDRQTRFTARMERYEKLLDELMELKRRCSAITTDLIFQGGTYSSGSGTDLQVAKLSDSLELIKTSAEVSRLVAPKAVFDVLHDTLDSAVAVYSAFTFGRDGNTGSPKLDSSLASFNNLVERFIVSMKEDLGFKD